MEQDIKVEQAGGVGWQAVRRATGKTWDEWFALLDDKEAAKKNHREIVGIVGDQGDIDGWWQQTVAVAYEQERGLRERHQKEGGYEVSRSKTINAPIAQVYRAVTDAHLRADWLGEDQLEERTARENKSARFTWVDGTSWIEARLYEKGESKCQVTVQHGKLSDADSAEAMKTFWSERLERLKTRLEG